MGLALQMYVVDHKTYPCFWRETVNLSGRLQIVYWRETLTPYSIQWMNPGYHCPSYGGDISLLWSSGVDAPFANHGSYAYNGMGAVTGGQYQHLGLGGAFSEDPSSYQYGQFVLRHSGALVPSQLFAFAESRTWLGGPAGQEKVWPANDLMQCGLTAGPGTPGVGLLHWWGYPPRHGKNYNIVFCDDHVEAMRPTVLFNPTNTATMWNNDHQPHPEYWPPVY